MSRPTTWNIPNAPVVGYAWEAADPVGAVLLTHALAEYAERYYDHYNGLIPALVAAGYSVYAYDLRGHGQSPGEIQLVDSEAQVRDHLAARAALKDLQPDLPLYLFAHSAGALFTAGSVMQDQSGLDGVILSSPMLQAGQDQVALVRHLLPLASQLAPGLAIVPINSKGLSRHPEEVRAYLDDPQIYHGRVTLLTAATMLTLSQRLWPHYETWQVPTLVFYGTADQVSYMEGLPEFVKRLSTSDKTLRRFEGGYHELLNDLDRDAALQLVLGWLRERRAEDTLSHAEQRLQHHRDRLERLRGRRPAPDPVGGEDG